MVMRRPAQRADPTGPDIAWNWASLIGQLFKPARVRDSKMWPESCSKAVLRRLLPTRKVHVQPDWARVSSASLSGRSGPMELGARTGARAAAEVAKRAAITASRSPACTSDRVRRAGEVQEDVFEIRLTGRDVDDAVAVMLDGGEHLAGIGLILAVGDDQGPFAFELDLLEAHI